MNEPMKINIPANIIAALRNIEGKTIAELGESLTIAVREASRIGTPLFIARSTCMNRPRWHFVCSNHQSGCEAFLDYMTRKDVIVLEKANFMHNHAMNLRTSRPYHSIDNDSIKKIRKMSEEGADTGHIRISMRTAINTQTFYSIRRSIPFSERRAEALKMFENIKTWVGWNSKTLVEDDVFTG
jgi:hypothetical protein